MSKPHPLRLRDFRWAFALVAASWLAAAWLYTELPERVPVHWNAAGEADRFGSRLEGALLPPALATGLVFLLAFVPRLDPRERNYARFRPAYLGLTYAILGFLLLVQSVTAIEMLGGDLGGWLDVGRVVLLGMGLLFVTLGRFLPELEPNWFAGIRTPWTLESEAVWRENHAFGGRAFAFMGAAIAFGALLLPTSWAFALTMAVAVGGSLVVVAHGWVVYQRLEGAAQAEPTREA